MRLRHMTVGELASALHKMDPDAEVWADTDPVSPCLMSHRANYFDLAISPGAPPATARELASALDEVVGETRTGYKGGEFLMGLNTPVYFAEYGTCGPMVVGLDESFRGVELLLCEES